MEMNRFVTLFLFVLFAITAKASEKQLQLMDSAAQYYADAKYEQAIEAYEDILADGLESAELYYNLGNAYFKSNKIAQAIVNYERAKRILPGDDDITFNLQLANTYVVDKIDEIPEFFLSSWWSRFIGLFTSNQWAYASLFSFVIGLLLLLLFFLSQKAITRRVAFWVGFVMIVVSVFTFNFSRKLKWMAENEPEAIIQTPSIVVKSSPSENGTELFLIHEGLKVKITDHLNDWREIHMPDGNKGWIKKGDVIII